MSSFGKGLSTDDYFSDIGSREEIIKEWTENKDKALDGLVDHTVKTKKFLKHIEEVKQPKVSDSILAVTNYLDEYSKMIDDVKAV